MFGLCCQFAEKSDWVYRSRLVLCIAGKRFPNSVDLFPRNKTNPIWVQLRRCGISKKRKENLALKVISRDMSATQGASFFHERKPGKKNSAKYWQHIKHWCFSFATFCFSFLTRLFSTFWLALSLRFSQRDIRTYMSFKLFKHGDNSPLSCHFIRLSYGRKIYKLTSHQCRNKF